MDPAKVANGWNRILRSDRNAWAPNLETSGPHWLKLSLAQKSDINTIHVTFEEQCADFRVEAYIKDSWTQIGQVTGNRDRRVVLRVDPVHTKQIRLVATGTLQRFVLCEVRLYAE